MEGITLTDAMSTRLWRFIDHDLHERIGTFRLSPPITLDDLETFYLADAGEGFVFTVTLDEIKDTVEPKHTPDVHQGIPTEV